MARRRRPRSMPRHRLDLLHVGDHRAAEGGDAVARRPGLRHRVVAGRPDAARRTRRDVACRAAEPRRRLPRAGRSGPRSAPDDPRLGQLRSGGDPRSHPTRGHEHVAGTDPDRDADRRRPSGRAHRGRPAASTTSCTAARRSTPAATTRALERFGPIFVQLFGQGETPMTATVLRRQDHVPELLGSAGRVRSGIEIRIVDGKDGPWATPMRSASSSCVDRR